MKYPKTLCLSDKYENDMRYDLNSVIVHNGKLNSGHYISVGLKKDKWIKFNDNKFEPLEKPGDELNQQAYILFYKRREY